jgi:ribose 5-phosphate isomerase A
LNAEDAKRAVAQRAAELVEDGTIVGLGTGSTADHFIDRLGDRLRGGLRVTGVPTSERSAERAHRLAIPLLRIEDAKSIDLACDGADEVDPEGRLLKGLGGALAREKIVARMARTFVVMVDASKLVPRLGTKCPVPVEVRPPAAARVADALTALGARPVPRNAAGRPFVTDNGNYIVDAWFHDIADPARLEKTIDAIDGVVANGIFVGLTDRVLVAEHDGVRETTFARAPSVGT